MSKCCTFDSNCIRETVTGASIRPLALVRGIDANGCVAYDYPSSLPLNLSVLDTPSVDLTLAGTVLSADVRISTDPNNQIVITPSGLFVPPAPITNIADTPTVDLVLTGSTLSANVIVSSLSGNQIQVLPTGLYVPPLAGLTVTDSGTIDFTLTGTNLTADVKADPTPGNQALVTPNGVYVPPLAGLTVANTNTIDLTLTGATLTADAIVSPNAGNVLVALGNGLYVPSPPPLGGLQVANTTSVDLTITGTTLTADVIISPNPGNQLTLQPNGLFVPPSPPLGGLTVSDTPSVDLTLTGTNLTADVKISATSGNQIIALADGLYVPAQLITSVANTATVALTVSGGTLTANTFVSPNAGNALIALANGLFVPANTLNLQNCSGAPLPAGSSLVTCPTTSTPWNINSHTPIAVVGGVPTNLTINPPSLCLPNNGNLLVTDASGNILTISVNNVATAYLPSVYVPSINYTFPQVNAPFSTIIDSFIVNNTDPCRLAVVFPYHSAALQISSSQPGGLKRITAEFMTDVSASLWNTPGTPGLTNAVLTGHNWRDVLVIEGQTEPLPSYPFLPQVYNRIARIDNLTGVPNRFWSTISAWFGFIFMIIP